jgi:hypothetical protein
MMIECTSSALLSFIWEAMIVSSSELILFSVAFISYLMMNSFRSLHITGTKSDKVSEENVLFTECQSPSKLSVTLKDDLECCSSPQTLTGCVLQEESEISSEQALVLQTESNQVALLLGGLNPDLAADVFSFIELSDVLHCAGLTCRSLNIGIWCQPDFWVGLGGPVFAESFRVAERPKSALPMIRSFRRWVFGLNGDWSLNVEQLGSFNHPGDALHSVLSYVQVLQVGDAELSDIQRLVKAAESSMQRADAKDNALLQVATEVVVTCNTRQDIFSSVDIKDLSAALATMEKRAEQEKNADERHRWFFSDEAASDELGETCAADANDLLSLSFLAVMEGFENH